MKAVFVGSFDPFTLGHYQIVASALSVFDRIIVGVAEDCNKNAALLNQRILMAKTTLRSLPNVEVMGFLGLTTDFCKKNDCKIILRGIRNAGDFEYERSILEVYKRLADVEVVYLMSQQPHISSSQVRLMARYGADLSGYIDPQIMQLVTDLYKQ